MGREYKIKEEKFEDGTSKFTPQFSEMSEIFGILRFYDFFNWFENHMVVQKFDTFSEAVNAIEIDKKKLMEPIETIIHELS